MLAGCERPGASPRGQSQQALLRRVDRSDSLLESATSQLRDLPSAVTTNLVLPEVVLDSTKSADGKDVMATCTANPSAPDGPINYLRVSGQNGRFRSLSVKPGDIVKYHAKLNQESLEAGFEERSAFDLTVAQVLDENILLVEGGLNLPATDPVKLEIWRYVDDRLVEISEQLQRYVVRRLPPVGWQPSPDSQALDQIVVLLNKWLRQGEPQVEWQVDPLLETLDAELAADEALAPNISKAALAADYFQPHDGRLLQEAVWLRDISRWAQGNRFEKLARAESLFDWTIRNIRLDADSKSLPQRPWQTLMYGHGTAEQRAWVFALLCRQQGLDVVMLGFAPKKEEAADADTSANGLPMKPKFWLPALFDDGQLYLFDSRLGLEIRGPGQKGVATFAQVQQDESLIRQLDLEGSPYPATAEQLKNVVAYVVADPFELTRRVRQVESKLTGDDRLALSVRASELAGRVKSLPGLTDVQIWDVPFRTLADQLTLGRSARHEAALAFEPFAWRPVLWKARTRHFQGRKQAADETKRQDPEDLADDHRDAARLYMDKSLRPPDREIATSAEEEQRIRRTAKLDATYWQGLLSFDDGKYDVASNWLGRKELTDAASPWAAGAHYNLARTLEAQGKLEDAAKLLEQDASPQRQGNILRAKRLREQK
ncbi:MAG: hypothetical protein WD468_06880 [Pirellulales bacterium]